MTKIEWCDETWNPVTGCTPISEGCEHCYAARMAARLAGRCGYPDDDPFRPGTVHPDQWDQPSRWRKPRKIFVSSMGDLFHDEVPFDLVDKVVLRTRRTPQHTYIILTKRPFRMLEYWTRKLPYTNGPFSNIWLGVTVENQARADERIPILLRTPAAVRLVSIEPMLGAVDLTYIKWARIPVDPDDYQRYGVPAPDEMWSTNNVLQSLPPDRLNRDAKVGLDWVICGGETGPGARPMAPEWARSLRDQCVDAGVPFYFKSMGEWSHLYLSGRGYGPAQSMDVPVGDGSHHRMYRVGKSTSGRDLDGRTWEQFPARRRAGEE